MPVMLVKLFSLIGVTELATSFMDVEVVRSLNTALNVATIYYLLKQERDLRKRVLPATERIEDALSDAKDAIMEGAKHG